MVIRQSNASMSWAIWRSKARDAAIKNQVKTDPHSPGMYRAYVPLQNVDTYQAFDIKKVTECTSRQKTELKSGSRLNNII
jgi:predicted metalloendopeptidase